MREIYTHTHTHRQTNDDDDDDDKTLASQVLLSGIFSRLFILILNICLCTHTCVCTYVCESKNTLTTQFSENDMLLVVLVGNTLFLVFRFMPHFLIYYPLTCKLELVFCSFAGVWWRITWSILYFFMLKIFCMKKGWRSMQLLINVFSL